MRGDRCASARAGGRSAIREDIDHGRARDGGVRTYSYRARRETLCRAHGGGAGGPAGGTQRACVARACAISQPHGCRATAPGGAPVCAETVAGALQSASAQPLLYESAMKRVKPQPRAARPARTAAAQLAALVQIEKPIYGGAFLARVEGKATFVPLTLPGEQVRVRIVDDKRSYTAAEPEQIVAPAPSRIVPGCPHFGACGGCHYQHANYETQLELKKSILRETLERGGVKVSENIEVL